MDEAVGNVTASRKSWALGTTRCSSSPQVSLLIGKSSLAKLLVDVILDKWNEDKLEHLGSSLK